TLSFDPESGSRLKLVGSLSNPLTRARDEQSKGKPRLITDEDFAGNYSRVHGQVGTTAYTLEDCFTVRHHFALGGLPTETVHANQVLRGALFEEGEALEATSVS